MGVFCCLYSERIILNIKGALLAACICVLIIRTDKFYWCFPVFFSYVLLAAVFGKTSAAAVRLNHLSGNISYEMYLCGFVIQQGIVALMGGRMDPHVNMAVCIPLDILCGYCLSRLINRKENMRRG